MRPAAPSMMISFRLRQTHKTTLIEVVEEGEPLGLTLRACYPEVDKLPLTILGDPIG